MDRRWVKAGRRWQVESRPRCYVCFRPRDLCFCRAIPRVANQTPVLILQHVAERFHPFNTARIVREALRRCDLVAGHNRALAQAQLPLTAGAVLLYPDQRAPTLSAGTLATRPRQLVIVDGTWHQAKTIVRDCPQLRTLPRFRLTPQQPGRYRIRREPDPDSLSTVEAAVLALGVLEPETQGLDRLLHAFDYMVEDQLARRSSVPARPREDRSGGAYHEFPRSLMVAEERLVVGYGEATPRSAAASPSAATPVNWVAQRMGSGRRFASRLRLKSPLSEAALQHMRLSPGGEYRFSTPAEFQRDWRSFLRPDDVLVVYHSRTGQLLQQVDAVQPRTLVLKAICGKTRSRVGSLEEVLRSEGIRPRVSWGPTRAHERLAMAVALLEHYRNAASSVPELPPIGCA